LARESYNADDFTGSGIHGTTFVESQLYDQSEYEARQHPDFTNPDLGT